MQGGPRATAPGRTEEDASGSGRWAVTGRPQELRLAGTSAQQGLLGPGLGGSDSEGVLWWGALASFAERSPFLSTSQWCSK